MNNLFYIQQCSSTNDEIISVIESSVNNRLTILYTFDQTNGRGQYGNTWKIAPNQNLAFSMAVLQEEIILSDNLLNFHTANILREFIAKKTDFEPKVKWPNDIILANKKISGMLIEKKKIANKTYLIIGIGVNILQKDFSDLSKAGSIFTQTKKEFDLKNWAEEMHKYFSEKLFESTSVEEVLSKYNKFLFKKDEISVFEINKIRQNGIIQRVDEQGFLWVELERDGLKKFYHKEIALFY